MEERRKRLRVKGYCGLTLVGLVLVTFILPAPGQAELSQEVRECLNQLMDKADDTASFKEMIAECEDKSVAVAADKTKDDTTGGLATQRVDAEEGNILKPFTLMAHRPNYLLFGAYNSKGYNPDVFRETFNEDDVDFKDTEARFQLSMKFPIFVNAFDKKIDIFAAYTNRSFWQLYADDISSPFRDTNHEPEAWVQVRPDWQILGFNNSVNLIGFNHQSNGRGGDLSRSWNRLFANFIFERENLVLSLKPWIRIEEDDEDDDNPDIEDFLGYGEIRLAYKFKEHTFSVMGRNIFESGFEKGTFELSWSFPLWNYPYFKGYVQYFNGYGESLIDYDRYANTIGVGIALTDFL